MWLFNLNTNIKCKCEMLHISGKSKCDKVKFLSF